MKNKFIVLLLLLTTWQVNAQKDEYIPLAVENAQWLILRDWPDTPFLDEYYGYKIMGDTIINDTAYKKVYKREFESVNQNYDPPYEIVNEYYYGAVRDDIENRKVYGRGVWVPGQDYLMFDFNLQIGDTNTGSMCQLIGDYTVNDIYYSTYQGYNTRVFELESFLCYIYLYEGIGTMNGLFESINCFEQEAFLDRYCRDMTDQECLEGFIVDVEKINSKYDINIFPNPAYDFIQIKNMDKVGFNKIIISDISSKNVIEINKNVNKINISKLNKGLYFINFYKENKLINTKKIIKS